MAEKDPDPAREANEQRNHTYKRISYGTNLICIGGVLLLNTLDAVDWGVWFDLVKLWPLLLISFGIRMIFVSTRLHLLSLLGPLLVLGSTVGFVAGHGDRPERWAALQRSGNVHELSCPLPPAGDPAKIDLTLTGGDFRLFSEDAGGSGARTYPAAASGTPPVAAGLRGEVLYEGRDPRPSCSEKGELRLGRGAGPGITVVVPFQGTRERWEARLSSAAPVDLNLSVAAAQVELDLRAFTMHEIDLDAAASSLALRLGRPSGRVPIRVDGGAVSLEILVPPGTCYTVRRDKGLTLLDAPDLRERARRRRRVSAAACGATDPSGEPPAHYELTLEVPFSRVMVSSDEATGA